MREREREREKRRLCVIEMIEMDSSMSCSILSKCADVVAAARRCCTYRCRMCWGVHTLARETCVRVHRMCFM